MEPGLAVKGVIDFVKQLGVTRLAAMAAVTAALIGFFAFVILRFTSPQMTPLFTDLAFDDSAAIIKDLERQAVNYEVRNDGAIIMVPRDMVTRLRMKFAEDGLPKGGGIGYEIFDKSESLGTTSFVQNINSLRALEGELARTIRAIDRVQAARVHLVLPERPLFSRDKADPSASIVLKVRGALDASQVRAIRHLVASAVSGLKPERISIVDESGRRPPTSARSPSRSGCASRSRRSSRRWSGRAAPRCSSPPISISTASPRAPRSSIRTAGSCARPRLATKAVARTKIRAR